MLVRLTGLFVAAFISAQAYAGEVTVLTAHSDNQLELSARKQGDDIILKVSILGSICDLKFAVSDKVVYQREHGYLDIVIKDSNYGGDRYCVNRKDSLKHLTEYNLSDIVSAQGSAELSKELAQLPGIRPTLCFQVLNDGAHEVAVKCVYIAPENLNSSNQVIYSFGADSSR